MVFHTSSWPYHADFVSFGLSSLRSPTERYFSVSTDFSKPVPFAATVHWLFHKIEHVVRQRWVHVYFRKLRHYAFFIRIGKIDMILLMGNYIKLVIIGPKWLCSALLICLLIIKLIIWLIITAADTVYWSKCLFIFVLSFGTEWKKKKVRLEINRLIHFFFK